MRRPLLTFLWLLSDALLFVGAYTLAYFVQVGWIFSTDLPFVTYLFAVAVTTPAWLFVMVTMRNYALSRRQRSKRNLAYIAYACLIGMAGFALTFYFFEQSLFSRKLLLMAGLFSAISIWLWHIVFDRIQRAVLRKNPPVYPLLIIGTNREAERLITRLQKEHSPFVPVAVLDTRSGPSVVAGVPVLGRLNKLEEILTQKKITHVVQCDALEQTMNLVSACTQHHITYALLPSLLGIIQQQERVMQLEGQPVVQVEHHARWQWFFR